MPIGDAVLVLLIGVCTAVALRPRLPRRSGLQNPSFWFGYLVNELPFVALLWLGQAVGRAALQGDLDTPLGVASALVAVLAAAGLVAIALRAGRTRAVVDAALDRDLGSDRRAARAGRGRWRWPWARILLWPFPWLLRPGVERIRNVTYGPAGRAHRLDVYRPRSGSTGGPVLVHFHGGAFRSGHKNLDAQPLVNRLVRRGWTCIDANYRLGPSITFPDQQVDAKRVIAWAKAHATEHGADSSRLVVAGSSAGGHVAATAALTPGDPRFQPGFEDADTTVSAAICLYPFPGEIATSGPPSSPHDYVHPAAPPFFVAHGDLDTIVVVGDARRFVDHLRSTSSQPVVYAELPGAQHGFDLFHSIRFEAVIHAVEEFTRHVLPPVPDRDAASSA